MVYPPTLPPTRTDSTLSAGNHAGDHNTIRAAIDSIIDALGADPTGEFADLTTRLEDLPTWDTVESSVGRVNTAREAVPDDGVTDARATLAACDTQAQALGIGVLLSPGTYRVASNITITSEVAFAPGAVLKPDAGVTVTLAGGVSSGLYQFADHSAGGLVVPLKVDAYHPAWWGTTGTADDSLVWTRMMAARTASAQRQVIRFPRGTNRIWEVDFTDVHLDAVGATIQAPVGSVGSDPRVTGHGYVVKFGIHVTSIGGEWSTGGIAGVTVLFQTGQRSWINGAYIRPIGVGSVGWLPYIVSGSITPRMSNSIVYGADGVIASSDTGTGIILNSADSELTNVWIGRVAAGLTETKGQTTYTGVHIWGCAGTGAEIVGGARINGLYTESNGGWGARLIGAGAVRGSIYAWNNGTNVANTGGVQLNGDGFFCIDNELDVFGDDNVGSHVALYGSGVSRNRVRIHSVSAKVRASLSPVTTQAVLVDATVINLDNEIEVRGSTASVVTALVTDPTGQRIDYGRFERFAAGVSLSSTTYTTLVTHAAGANQTWAFRALIIVEGAQSDDLKVRAKTTAVSGATGYFGLVNAPAASSTSTTAISLIGTSAQAIGGAGLTAGLIGAGAPQVLEVIGHIAHGANAGNIILEAALQAATSGVPAVVRTVSVEFTRVG